MQGNNDIRSDCEYKKSLTADFEQLRNDFKAWMISIIDLYNTFSAAKE